MKVDEEIYLKKNYESKLEGKGRGLMVKRKMMLFF